MRWLKRRMISQLLFWVLVGSVVQTANAERISNETMVTAYQSFLKESVSSDDYYAIENVGVDSTPVLLIGKGEMTIKNGEVLFDGCDVYYYMDGQVTDTEGIVNLWGPLLIDQKDGQDYIRCSHNNHSRTYLCLREDGWYSYFYDRNPAIEEGIVRKENRVEFYCSEEQYNKWVSEYSEAGCVTFQKNTNFQDNTAQVSAYILSDSDRRYLDKDELLDMPLQVINYAKNEIYARRGRKFQSEELQRYFMNQNWYDGWIEPEDFQESMLNDYEYENAQLLRNLEYQSSETGYSLDQPGYSFQAVCDYIYTHQDESGTEQDEERTHFLEALENEEETLWEGYSERAYATEDFNADGKLELVEKGKQTEENNYRFVIHVYDASEGVVKRIGALKSSYEDFYYSPRFNAVVTCWKTSTDNNYIFYSINASEIREEFVVRDYTDKVTRWFSHVKNGVETVLSEVPYAERDTEKWDYYLGNLELVEFSNLT